MNAERLDLSAFIFRRTRPKLNTEKIAFFRYLILEKLSEVFRKINTEKMRFFRYLILTKIFRKNFFAKIFFEIKYRKNRIFSVFILNAEKIAFFRHLILDEPPSKNKYRKNAIFSVFNFDKNFSKKFFCKNFCQN